MSAIIKQKYNDDIFLNVLIKNVRRVIRMRKNVKQLCRVCDIIIAINYVTYYYTNVVNAKMQRL